MDKVIVEKVYNRENFMKNHELKYIEFKALVPNRLGKLQEIVESLPEGKQRATATEIIAWIHTSFQEVLKDYDALHEGSQLRNLLDDYVLSIKTGHK
jgi:hypothetical protein